LEVSKFLLFEERMQSFLNEERISYIYMFRKNIYMKFYEYIRQMPGLCDASPSSSSSSLELNPY
jgi:hypothetical protein